MLGLENLMFSIQESPHADPPHDRVCHPWRAYVWSNDNEQRNK